jgi:hypothetical protein
MCKINVETDLYYAHICKHDYEKNMTKLCCKIMLKIGVEHIKGNEGSYSYLYPFGTWLKKTSKEALCVHQVRKFFENFLNWKSIMS